MHGCGRLVRDNPIVISKLRAQSRTRAHRVDTLLICWPQDVGASFEDLVHTKAENSQMCLDELEDLKDELWDAAGEGLEITNEEEIVMEGVQHHNETVTRRDTIGLKQQELLKRFQQTSVRILACMHCCRVLYLHLTAVLIVLPIHSQILHACRRGSGFDNISYL